MKTLYIVIVIIFTAVTISMSCLARSFETRPVKQINIPKELPQPGNRDLYRTIQMYDIKIPEGIDFPTFNSELDSRGSTIYQYGKIRVEIGPTALISWPILASTLAHEFEVHCNQSFLAINILDASNLDGTNRAERQAYDYEIDNAKSFGLSESEINMIRETKDYFYPK